MTRIDLDDVKITLDSKYGDFESGNVVSVQDLLEYIEVMSDKYEQIIDEKDEEIESRDNKIEELTEKLQLTDEYIRERTRPISDYAFYGVSESDF